MLRYRTTFIRSLVLVWMATWILADPLCLLQELMAPQEYSASSSVSRNGPLGTHVTQHHSDVLVSSSSEGNPNLREDPQPDESEFVDCVDMWRFDHVRVVDLTSVLPLRLPFSTTAAPRAPPSAWL